MDHPLDIEAAHIDHMGHVNNAVYLNWVQEAVLTHWEKLAPEAGEKLAPEAARASYLWVALKHEITYRKAAFLEDNLVASVVLTRVRGVRAFYRTVIRRGEDVLAEVESVWCSIDADTRRPFRLPRDVVRKFLPD